MSIRHSAGRKSQQGITLVVGLILLILITLMVTTAFTLNTANLKSVGNMQVRNESIAAANRAVEFVVGNSFPSGFTVAPVAQTITYDINNDGTADYSVSVASPTCIETHTTSANTGSGSCGGVHGGGLAGCSTSNYSSLWEIKATVTDASTGAQVTVTQGVRMELTEAQKTSACS